MPLNKAKGPSRKLRNEKDTANAKKHQKVHTLRNDIKLCCFLILLS